MPSLEIEEIMRILPHRYPMLMVDRVVECDDESRIVAVKCVTVNEPCFQGHFPGVPVMPGVLQLEAMAQTGGILMNRIGGMAGLIPYFMAIDKARFRRVVRPGDVMTIEAVVIKKRAKSAKFTGRITVGDELASEAELMCMITEQKSEQ